jgi:hypothetical protein
VQIIKGGRKKSRVTDVGGFKGMLRANQKGRVKGMPWLMKTLVNIYVDYLVQQRFMARDGEPGKFADFNEFVYRWHMSQFGLKQIADLNLIGLIVSVRSLQNSHKVMVSLFHLQSFFWSVSVLSNYFLLLFADFDKLVYCWHMSQFRLKQIVELNVIDLIVTVRSLQSSHKVTVSLVTPVSSFLLARFL